MPCSQLGLPHQERIPVVRRRADTPGRGALITCRDGPPCIVKRRQRLHICSGLARATIAGGNPQRIGVPERLLKGASHVGRRITNQSEQLWCSRDRRQSSGCVGAGDRNVGELGDQASHFGPVYARHCATGIRIGHYSLSGAPDQSSSLIEGVLCLHIASRKRSPHLHASRDGRTIEISDQTAHLVATKHVAVG